MALPRVSVVTLRICGQSGTARDPMGDYQIGGGLRLLTALEKTQAFSEFLQKRMVRALEAGDPTEVHYLLAQLDDYHSFMWRYYKKLQEERGDRAGDLEE